MDRSIVRGVDSDPILAKLAQSLVDFAHGFDASVVAEGVETAAEHAVLRGLGVDGGQGWFFGRPGPADALADEGRAAARVSAHVRPSVAAFLTEYEEEDRLRLAEQRRRQRRHVR